MCFGVFSLLTYRFDWIVRASEFSTNDLNYTPRLSEYIYCENKGYKHRIYHIR